VLDFDPASGRTSTPSADRVIAYVEAEGLTTEWLLETHVHADHLSAAPYLQAWLCGKVAIGQDILTVQSVFGKIFNGGPDFLRDGSQLGRLLRDGERFRIGSLAAMALHTAGHTPADMAYVIGDAAFIGDTLFMPDYGTARVDFPGGDARTLFRSIHRCWRCPITPACSCAMITRRPAATLSCGKRPWVRSGGTMSTSIRGSPRRLSWRCARRGMPRWACRA
jgi:glyoxylase-like metal-dependent hydrolase (beta-lactamase superfamily II)